MRHTHPRRHRRARRGISTRGVTAVVRAAALSVALSVALSAALLAGCSWSGDEGSVAGNRPTTPTRPRDAAGGASLRVEGRWFVDRQGRVVLPRGVNMVEKAAPFYPAAAGFGPDDARFLADLGFDTVRLGVMFQGLMPTPGEVDEAYLDHLATTVDDLADAGISVVLDFHQDGYSPRYKGGGFPDWLAIDDGGDNPDDAKFPLYYVQSRAMQEAFHNFWTNRKGPDGIGLQAHFLTGVHAVAKRFASSPSVLGYELINEPFPGPDYAACLAGGDGCHDVEQRYLVPFARRATAAVRSASSDQAVWVEPFAIFNFGKASTSLPGRGTDALLAVHSYALDERGEQGVVDQAVAARARDHKPVLITEFGADAPKEALERMTAAFDRAMLPWLFWTYDEQIITDPSAGASLEAVKDLDRLEALVRPHPAAVAGTPTSFGFDPRSGRFDLAYATTGPDGRTTRKGLATVVAAPPLAFPDGYRAVVRGGRVTSKPCAPRVTVVADPGVTEVRVRLERADERPRACGS